MKAVVDYVHSKNMSFGLYTCSGLLTCVGGRPGSFGHWQQDADVFAEWGVDWVKQDFCFVPAEFKNNPQPLYANMSAALNATGRAIAFSMCEWGVAQPWLWGDAVAQSWREAGDHTGVWSSTKSVIRSSAAIPAANTGRPYGWNDMVGPSPLARPPTFARAPRNHRLPPRARRTCSRRAATSSARTPTASSRT
jgi:alpha-galactosidase